jgi:hypothetical protein
MKRSFPLRYLPIIGALAFLFMASMIAVQNGQASFPQSDNGSRESRKLRIKLLRDDGKVVIMTQFVGKMMTTTFNSQSFGLVPKVDDQSGAVSIVLHRLGEKVGDGVRLAKEIETISVSKTSPTRSSTVNLPFSLMIDEKSEISGETVRPTPAPASFLTAAAPGQRPQYLLRTAGLGFFQAGPNNCCVTCDGQESCACAVEADCGSCCAPRCCGEFL